MYDEDDRSESDDGKELIGESVVVDGEGDNVVGGDGDGYGVAVGEEDG